MGPRGIRGAVAVVVLALGILAATALAGKQARLGPELPRDADFSKGCGAAQGCIYFNNRLAKRSAGAPFGGKVVSWRIQGATGTFALDVIRPLRGGTFKLVREGPLVAVNVAFDEVERLDANLKIAKGDYVGIYETGTSSFAGEEDPPKGSCFKALVPAPEVGGQAEPNPNYASCGTIALYNAKIKGRG
jgi:hypothetical protein